MKRSYGQNCALAHASDIVGERWTLLIIRDLLIRPRRYSELARSMKGMGTNLLAARLKRLEADGLIESGCQPNGKNAYQLTPRGRELEATILALIRWGFGTGPETTHGYHHQDDWDLLAMKAAFRPPFAPKHKVTVQFAGPEPFWVRINRNTLDFGFGTAPKANIRIKGTIAELHQCPKQVFVEDPEHLLDDFLAAFSLS